MRTASKFLFACSLAFAAPAATVAAETKSMIKIDIPTQREGKTYCTIKGPDGSDNWSIKDRDGNLIAILSKVCTSFDEDGKEDQFGSHGFHTTVGFTQIKMFKHRVVPNGTFDDGRDVRLTFTFFEKASPSVPLYTPIELGNYYRTCDAGRLVTLPNDTQVRGAAILSRAADKGIITFYFGGGVPC